MCDQLRLRPACAYAQTDQSLCLSLNYDMSVKLLIERNLVFLSITLGCTGLLSLHLLKWHIVGDHISRFKHSQSVTCLATDACLTSDPGVPSLIAARSNTFMEIDHEIISTVIFLPSAESFKKVVVSYKRKYALKLLFYFD